MNEILHANIFFFIASVATVVFVVFVSVILYHVTKIIKSIRVIVEKVEAGSEVLAGDISDLREQVMSGGFISRFLGLFFGMKNFSDQKKRRSRRSSGRTRKTKIRDVEESDE